SIELPDTVVANVNDLTKVAEGTSVTLTVNVPNGKELVELIVDGNKVEVTNNQYTFEITKDIVVSVEYKNAPIYYTITLPEWVISSAGTRVLENTETGLTIINIPQFDLYYSLLLNGKKVNVEEEKYYNFVVTENIEIKIEFNLDKIEITPILEAQNSENGDVFIAGILSKKVGQYKYQVTNQEGSIEVSVYEDQAEDVLEYLDALIGKKVILKTDKYDDFIYIYYTADVLEYDYVEKEKYDVTFNTNGGSQLESIKVVEGKKITKPSNPEKLNSIFVGWFSDEELTVAWDFDQVVNSAVTLYAKWDLVSFTKSNVFTISEDGKIIYQAITVLVNGVKILVTDATELLLIDGSLYVNALEDKTYEDILEINGELITVSYSFEKEIVEVTSAAISGEFKYNSELGKFYKGYNVLVDGNILEIKDPEFVLTARKNQDVWTKGILTNTGSGVWFDSNKEQGLYEFVAIDKDGLIYLTTIDFTFESKTYEVDSVEALLNVVEINKNETETTIILINDIVFEVEREIRFINKVTITGGKELKNVYLEVIEGSNIEGITVTEPEKTRHTVIFESEGLEIEKVNVIEGQKVAAIANPERQGYIFAGWLNNDTIFNFDTEINSNITLTAKWDNESISGVLESIEANSKTITITFTSAVKFKGIRLEELDLTSADTKFELLNSLFFIYSYTQQQEREVLSSALMNIENVQIITSKDSIKITLGDNVFNREFYKQIVNEERYENGIYRMTVERLEYNDFTHAINDSKVVGGQENTSFRVKFSLPFANGVVDLDGTLNAIFQTKEQAENDSATDPKVDKYAPQIEEAEFNIVNGRLVLVVKAYDENLKELEIDHNLERLAELPEFSVYADSTNPYGDSKNAFEQLGVIVTFKDGEWTITFGESREEIIKNNTNKFVVYFVVSDYAGNKFGSMDPTTPGNTIEINVYNVSTTIYEDVIEKKVFEGEKLDLEAPKSNDEYMFEFDAWYLDNTKYDVNEPVNSDLALVAKFNEIVYLTIEEVLALGKGKDVKVRAILEKRVKDSNFDIIDSTGRIRIYKSKSDSELSNAIGKEVIIIGTRDVYDREQVQQIAWTEIKILDLTDERKLHYVSNSDLTEVRKFEVEMGSEVMLPTEITKLGIKVDIEWNLDEFVTDNKFNSVTESKTVELVGYLISGDARKEIKAELIIKKVAFHEITFKVEGFEDIIVTYKEDEDIKSPNFSLPEGKRITGWYLDLELTEVYEFGKATSALIIYGKVEETSYLIVTYNLNGGNFEEGIVPKTEYINDEKLVKPENPVREGFAFVGWFRDELLQTEWIFIDDEINSNITLYAKWEEKNEEINTYDLDFINVNYPTSYSSGKYSVKNLINGEQTEIVTFDKVFKDNGARLNKKGSIVIELESKIKRIEIKIAIWTVKETTSIEFQTIDGSSWKKEFELIEKMNSPKDKQYVSIVLEGLDIDRFKLYSDGRFLVQNIKIWQ
ncbi:InlB B-repeat-containing protein, partial [Haploplasma axanthum]